MATGASIPKSNAKAVKPELIPFLEHERIRLEDSAVNTALSYLDFTIQNVLKHFSKTENIHRLDEDIIQAINDWRKCRSKLEEAAHHESKNIKMIHDVEKVLRDLEAKLSKEA